MAVVRRSRAFTLIELMVVVVLVGVLALLATMAYRRWIRSSYLGEAHDMLANIRASEETFRAENTGYLNVSTDLATLYPAAMPTGNIKTQWGDNPGLWTSLNINPNGPVRFGYAVIADNLNAVALPAVQNQGKAVDISGMQGQPWFVATAVCDIDNDTSTPSTTLYVMSGNNSILVNNEGN